MSYKRPKTRTPYEPSATTSCIGEWILNSRDAMRPASDIGPLLERGDRQEQEAYLREWEREAKASPDWARMPSRSLEYVPPPTLTVLHDLELRLSDLVARVRELGFVVASSRVCGKPAGYRTDE